MNIRELDRRSLRVLDKIVSGVTETDFSLTTPCSGWDLADLLRHQVSENQAFAVALKDGSAPDWDGGSLGSDAYRAYAGSVDAVLATFDDDAVLDRQVTVREFGTFPGSFALQMHLVDSVAHGWDIAKTLDVPYEPDGEAVDVALKFAEIIPADPAERVARGSFAVVVETQDGASPLDRFLALLGRDPHWQRPTR